MTSNNFTPHIYKVLELETK